MGISSWFTLSGNGQQPARAGQKLYYSLQSLARSLRLLSAYEDESCVTENRWHRDLKPENILTFGSEEDSSQWIQSIIDTGKRGCRLAFDLYDFSMSVSAATGDIDQLASEINSLALQLRRSSVNGPTLQGFHISKALQLSRRGLVPLVIGLITSTIAIIALLDANGRALVGHMFDTIKQQILSLLAKLFTVRTRARTQSKRFCWHFHDNFSR